MLPKLLKTCLPVLITLYGYSQSKFSIDPSIGITTTSYTKTIRPNPSLRLNTRYMFTKVVGVNGGFGLDVYGKSYDIMWLGSIRTRLSNYDKFITHSEIGGGITFLKKGDSPFFTNWKNNKTDRYCKGNRLITQSWKI